MKRVKVALDVNIPQRSVRMLNSAYGDQGFEFIYESQFASSQADDEFWATAFRRFGGEIVISADKNIAKRPHQIIAFQDNDLISFFCESRWASTDGTYKIAHLIYWWPRIQAKLASCARRDCWWVPFGIGEHEFRKVTLPSHVEAKARAAKAGG